DSAHKGPPPAHGSQLHTEPQMTQSLPTQDLLDPGVERLRPPHARSARDDDEVVGLEPRGLAVQLLEPGRDPGDVFLALVESLDVLERVLEDLADRKGAAQEAPFGEAEDPALGVVHE